MKQFTIEDINNLSIFTRVRICFFNFNKWQLARKTDKVSASLMWFSTSDEEKKLGWRLLPIANKRWVEVFLTYLEKQEQKKIEK